jgi:hypothetical protein
MGPSAVLPKSDVGLDPAVVFELFGTERDVDVDIIETSRPWALGAKEEVVARDEIEVR